MHLVADANVEGPIERLPLDHLESRARGDAALAEEAEHRRVGVGDAHERPLLARLERVQTAALVGGDRQLRARDRVAMRVERRVAELGGDQLLELLGEDMLEPLGLGVHLVPAHAQALDQEQLEQAMVANHLERDGPSALGQTRTAIQLMLDQPERGQLAQHRRHRRRANVEPFRQGVRRGRPLARLERVDRLRVVLNRSRQFARLNYIVRHD